MTKDEIRKFVLDTISMTIARGVITESIENAAEKIVAKWEEDVESNRDEAFTNGVIQTQGGF